MDIMNKKVLVFGSGISGIAASRLLEKKGAKVIQIGRASCRERVSLEV